MRRHLLWVLPLCAFLAAMAFGMIKRQTYKDIFEQENYLPSVYIGNYIPVSTSVSDRKKREITRHEEITGSMCTKPVKCRK